MSPSNPAAPKEPSPLFEDFTREFAATRRVLERFPSDHDEWRPHAKSRTLLQLASHIAGIPTRGTMILATEGLDMATARPAGSPAPAGELVARFDANVAEFQRALAKATPDDLSHDWVMSAGDQVIVRDTKRSLMRLMVVSHLIHHRAQLGVYYRLLDVPVPGVYGPSADESI